MPGALFHLLGLPVTAYALGMAASLLLSAALLLLCAGRAGIPPKTAETFLLLALPLGLIAARLDYVLVRLPFFLGRGDGLAFRFWQGGTTLWGALAGFLLAARLSARLEHMETGRLLDAFAPAGLTLLALGRFCEGLAGQGFGEEALPQLSFFPFAVPNEWGEWRWAVFLLSGLAALLFILPVLRAKGLQPGGRARLALILVCAFQILFESFREDEAKNLIHISAVISVEKESQKAILIGRKGAMLKKIGTEAREAMERLFGAKVFLELFVRVSRDWTLSDKKLREFGLIK